MKKNYLKPEMDVMEFVTEAIMTKTSFVSGNDEESNDQTHFGSNERRGGSGNIWD